MNGVVAILIFLSPLVTSQRYVSSPEVVTVCDAQSLPQMFNVSCSFISSFLPNWIVTRLDDVTDQALGYPESVGSLNYTMASTSMDSVPGVATLTVDRSAGMEVTVGSCFMCRHTTVPPTDSDVACVEEIAMLPCVTDVEVKGTTESMIEITWTPPMPGLNYSIQSCPNSVTFCEVFSCTNCASYTANNLQSGVNYTITVNSVAQVTGGFCESRNCSNNSVSVATNATESTLPSPTFTTSLTPSPSDIPGNNGDNDNMIAGTRLIGVIVGCIVGVLIVVALVVIIIIVAVLVFKRMSKNKTHGEKLTAHHGEEMVDVHGDTTYAAPDKDKTAVEGGDGVYSYAATTTVVGAKHSKPKPGSEKKVAEDVSAQPEKPVRGSKKQPPPSDVHHKQGPVGDLYAMPDKKAAEVGHKAGPQGDMYAVAGKPSKGGYGAEGPN